MFLVPTICQNNEDLMEVVASIIATAIFSSGFLRHFETEAMTNLWELAPTKAKKIFFAESILGT